MSIFILYAIIATVPYMLLFPYDLIILANLSITYNLYICIMAVLIAMIAHLVLQHRQNILLVRDVIRSYFFIILFAYIIFLSFLLYSHGEAYASSKLHVNSYIGERELISVILTISAYMNAWYNLRTIQNNSLRNHGLLLSLLSTSLSYALLISMMLYCSLSSDFFKYFSLSVNCDISVSKFIDINLNSLICAIYIILNFLYSIRIIQLRYTRRKWLWLIMAFYCWQIFLYTSFLITNHYIESKINEPISIKLGEDVKSCLNEISESIHYEQYPSMLPWRLSVNLTIYNSRLLH